MPSKTSPLFIELEPWPGFSSRHPVSPQINALSEDHPELAKQAKRMRGYRLLTQGVLRGAGLVLSSFRADDRISAQTLTVEGVRFVVTFTFNRSPGPRGTQEVAINRLEDISTVSFNHIWPVHGGSDFLPDRVAVRKGRGYVLLIPYFLLFIRHLLVLWRKHVLSPKTLLFRRNLLQRGALFPKILLNGSDFTKRYFSIPVFH
ncbi:hypothetical protein COY07_02600 [Candidatus Peregrinibacteria bacterium CG_4_10_14_0_2_um_filter_43_11]|nr:MAG: hypothetical protein COY07_02600 [Candidatus Peregrinibacteria bacterium CG_4_10_14_0_2_um_filter_43_11]